MFRHNVQPQSPKSMGQSEDTLHMYFCPNVDNSKNLSENARTTVKEFITKRKSGVQVYWS